MNPWKHGAELIDDATTRFRVWAPFAGSAAVVFPDRQGLTLNMEAAGGGYFQVTSTSCSPGTRYLLKINDDTPRPDPASRCQPDGVHEPSAVVDPRFDWTDNKWAGLPLEEYVIYELHVGTFTESGTFEAAIDELPRLKELGITAVEIMPIAQFPGDRNWGYDGTYPYAVQASYGGLTGFQTFVNAAHNYGLAVILDVVYNHLGPEGNYLQMFGPYFTSKYLTPWGASLNFDDAHSDAVREYFIGNALFWVDRCHVDALRLDAVHAIIDTSSLPFLQQLTQTIHATARRLHKRIHVIGENDRNDPKFAMSPELGGIGADSQWSDDFHHALHSLLTGEQHAYYEGFGKVSHLAKAMADGFVYDGCYSPHRHRHHGANSRGLEGIRFVVCSQNHDQVGNRPLGDRLSMLLDLPRIKLAAIATLTAPAIPLLFMGEETGSLEPFLYFVSHGDEALVLAVQEGRANEFRDFFAHGTAPDPQSPDTYMRSKLKQDTSSRGESILNLYKDLIVLRKTNVALMPQNKRESTAVSNDYRNTLAVLRPGDSSLVLILYNFSSQSQAVTSAAPSGEWTIILDSENPRYGGMHSRRNEPITSEGELTIDMPASSALVLESTSNGRLLAPK